MRLIGEVLEKLRRLTTFDSAFSAFLVKQKLLRIPRRVCAFPKSDIGMNGMIEQGTDERHDTICTDLAVRGTERSVFVPHVLSCDRAEWSIPPRREIEIELPARILHRRDCVFRIGLQVLFAVVLKHFAERWHTRSLLERALAFIVVGLPS